MTYLSALKQHLVNSGITDTIYLTFLAAKPDKAICIMSVPGSPPDFKHNYDNPAIQIKVRGDIADNDGAEQLANQVYSYLHGIGTMTISGIFFSSVAALQNPFLLKYDEENRPVYIANFTIEYYNETTNRV